MACDEAHYRVRRFFFNPSFRTKTIIDKCTLAEAQAHCEDPETSSSTCTSTAGRRRTKQYGPWFDGYEAR